MPGPGRARPAHRRGGRARRRRRGVRQRAGSSGAGPTCAAFEERFAAVCGDGARAGHPNCGSRAAPGAAGARRRARRRGHRRPTTPSRPPATRCCGPARRPVFADVRPDIWTVDPAAVEAADHPAHRRHHRRRRRSGSPPTTTSCARSPTGTGCSWSRTPPAPRARPTGAGPPAASPTSPASASTAARASPRARAARSPPTDAGLADAARKLHTYGIEPARRARAAAPTLPVPSFDEAGLQLPALRRRSRHHARPARPAARPAAPRAGAVAARVRRAARRTSSRSTLPVALAGPRAPVAVLRPHAATRRRPRRRRARAARPRRAVQHRHVRLAPAAGLRPQTAAARSRPTSSPATWRSRCTPTSPTSEVDRSRTPCARSSRCPTCAA